MPIVQDIPLGEALIAAGANIEAEAGSFGTPLHNAASSCQWQFVEMLVDRGADVAREKYGLSALDSVGDDYFEPDYHGRDRDGHSWTPKQRKQCEKTRAVLKKLSSRKP